MRHLEARAEKDPNGFYDDQIAEAKKELSSLESAAARAEVGAISADRELEKVTNKRDLHIGRTRERAANFHRDEVKERTTQAEREAEQTRLAKAQDEIDQEWNSDLSAVQKESGLSGELWDRMRVIQERMLNTLRCLAPELTLHRSSSASSSAASGVTRL